MRIKNVSNKVIGIGGAALLPNEEMELNGKQAAHPVIRTYMAQGLLVYADTKAAVKDPGVAASADATNAEIEKYRTMAEAAQAEAERYKAEAEAAKAENAKTAKTGKKADKPDADQNA